MYSPVIVVGTGRCGTSTVARILHTELGVCMGGSEIGEPDDTHKHGVYEDNEFVEINRRLLRGLCTLPEWSNTTNAMVQKRFNSPWGFKDPHSARLLWMYFLMFDDTKVIWCKRAKDLVIKSILTNWKTNNGVKGYNKKTASDHYDMTMLILERTLIGRQHLVVDFGGCLIPESLIKQKLVEFLE